jgi:hypothetical protein
MREALARLDRQASERRFEHTDGGLIDFMHVFVHSQLERESLSGDETLFWKGLFGRAAGI